MPTKLRRRQESVSCLGSSLRFAHTLLTVKHVADMLFIGPNDLACSLGNGSTPHMQIPAVQDAIETIRKEAERAGKLSGIFCVSAEQAADRYKQGFQMINIGGDIVAITLHRGSSLHPCAAPARTKGLTISHAQLQQSEASLQRRSH